MKRLLISLTLFSSLFLSSCSKLPNNSTEISDPGSANISISIVKVGALGKIRNIELSKLYLTLSAPGETTIRDTFSLNGNAGGTYAKTYSNLASFLKTWTLVAESRDIDGNLIHYGDTSFIVPARSTIPVNLTLGAKYSMLKANFFPIRDSVTRCELLVNGTKQDDSSFAKQTLVGDTVRLSYNYLDTGVAQRIKLNVYGTMWGFDTLLYSGDTLVTPFTGANASYSIVLKWVGPALPPPGEASMTVTLGAVGTTIINGYLQPNVLFEDDFSNGINWNITGNSVTFENGIMSVNQNSNDADGGIAISNPFPVDTTRLITITDRVSVYTTGDPFHGGILYRGTNGLSGGTGVGYWNYPGGGAGPATYGFGCTNAGYTEYLPALWGQWIEEKIVYNPVDGTAAYSINGGASVSLCSVKLSGQGEMEIYVRALGWFTGHKIQFDWIKIEQ